MLNRKEKDEDSLSFIILALITIISLFAVIFMYTELFVNNENSIKEDDNTPIVYEKPTFTAKVSVQDVETPRGCVVNASEFIVNGSKGEEIDCKFEEAVDFNEVGTFEVKIRVVTSNGAYKNCTANLIVYEPDKVAPVITCEKERKFLVGENITYMKDVKATDDVDGELEVTVDKSAIVLDEKGNPVAGEYDVIYSATDKAGNVTEVVSKFIIEEVKGEPVYEVAESILATIIKDDMTDVQKAYAIYNYTYDNIAYTGSSEKGDYKKEAYNGLTKFSGDCYTYYAVAKVMLECIGIESIDVQRKEGARSSTHYWLLIDLGTGYYHFDSTRRKQYFDGFMATDAQVQAYSKKVKNYYAIDNSLYPATPTTEFKFEKYAG